MFARVTRTALVLMTCFGGVACSASNSERVEEAAPPPEVLHVDLRVRVDEVSPIPDPTSSVYPDCLFVARMSVASESTPNAGPPAGAQFLGVFEAFRGREPSRASGYEAGTLLDVAVIPFELAPNAIQETQRVDTIEAFDLPMFWCKHSIEVGRAEPAALAETVAREVTPRDPRLPPAPAAERANRARRLARDLAALEDRIAGRGVDYVGWYASLEPFRREVDALFDGVPQHGAVLRDGHAIGFESLKYLRTNPGVEHFAGEGPLRAVIDTLLQLHVELAHRNIDLIVVPTPQPIELAPESFAGSAPDDGIVHPYRYAALHALMRAGVEVVDLVPTMRRADDCARLFYRAADAHPADPGTRHIAAAIGERLRDYGAFSHTGAATRRTPVEFTIPESQGRLFPAGFSTTAQQVRFGDSLFSPRMDWSPAVLVGDSHAAAPSFYGVRSANVTAHVAAELGHVVNEVVGGAFSANVCQHLARRGPAFWFGRRVCVFVFHFPYAIASSNRPWRFTPQPTIPLPADVPTELDPDAPLASQGVTAFGPTHAERLIDGRHDRSVSLTRGRRIVIAMPGRCDLGALHLTLANDRPCDVRIDAFDEPGRPMGQSLTGVRSEAVVRIDATVRFVAITSLGSNQHPVDLVELRPGR